MSEAAQASHLRLVSPSYVIKIIPAKELPKAYEGYVYSKWLRTLRFGNPLFKNIEPEAFYKHYHQYLEVLMSKPDSLIRLAVLTDDHDVVLGFSVSREDVLDYVYVHKDYRGHGIAKKLFPLTFTVFTHITLSWIEIWRKNKKYNHLQFNPFA